MFPSLSATAAMPFVVAVQAGNTSIRAGQLWSSAPFSVLFILVLLSLVALPQVTASERAVSKDGASTMDSASPRGSKRGVEEVKTGGQKMGGGERPAPTPERDGRSDEEIGEGDAAAGRGDLDLCKRNEVRYVRTTITTLSRKVLLYCCRSYY